MEIELKSLIQNQRRMKHMANDEIKTDLNALNNGVN